MTAARQFQLSPATFTPGPGWLFQPIYNLACDFAASLAYDDGVLLRPPMIPTESFEEALAAGYIFLDRELLPEEAMHGDSFITLLADSLYRLCTSSVLDQRGSHDELTAAHSVLTDAYRQHEECIDPEAEPHFFQAVEQAEAHVDRLGWELLIQYGITPLPSLLFAFLITDDHTRAARVFA